MHCACRCAPGCRACCYARCYRVCTQSASAPTHGMFDAMKRPAPWRDACSPWLLVKAGHCTVHSRLPDAVLGDVQAARVCARNLQVLPTMSCLMPRGGRSHGVMHAAMACWQGWTMHSACVCPRMPCLQLCKLLPCVRASCKCSQPCHVHHHMTAGPMA